MSTLDVPGARLYYETRGSGPLMLLIPGANGDANGFPPLADVLAADFTVVTYDRRGYTRSALLGAQDYARRLETDADDARQLIQYLSDEPAVVFGTSSGGIIALQLLIDHPQVVRALVSFEPAAMRGGCRKGVPVKASSVRLPRGGVARPDPSFGATFDGYVPLVEEIVKFFQTKKSVVPSAETIELFAFMEAADESKRQGGKPVRIGDVLEKAKAKK